MFRFFAAGVAVCLVSCGVGRAQESKPGDPVRATVGRTVDWIARQAVPVKDAADAVRFRDAAETEDEPEACIYGGTAGVLIFLENAAAVLNDERARKLADATAKGLLVTRGRDKNGVATWSRGNPGECAVGLYVGDAGIGDAFLVRARLRKDSAALATAVEVGDAILARGKRQGDTLHWADEQIDIIFGAAGTLLYLLDLGAETKEKRFTDAALAAGRWLITRADSGSAAESRERRLFWRCPMFNKHMPNFSHGTSGVAYALARVAAATKDEACLRAAKDGAAWLLEHAMREGDRVSWAASEGGKRCLGGWCHGPPGTARLFLLLHQQTGEPLYLETALASARWVMSYGGAAETKNGKMPDFPPSLCCGVAGVLDFFCDLHRVTGNPEFADFAARAGSYLIGAAKPDGGGVKWRNGASAHGKNEDRYGIDLMLGASGEAMALLRLATLRDKADPIQHLPDRAVGAK